MTNTKLADVIAKAMADEKFKQALKSDPTKALTDQGVKITPGVEVRVVENTEKVRYVVLPDASVDLNRIVGGKGNYPCNYGGCL